MIFDIAIGVAAGLMLFFIVFPFILDITVYTMMVLAQKAPQFLWLMYSFIMACVIVWIINALLRILWKN